MIQAIGHLSKVILACLLNSLKDLVRIFYVIKYDGFLGVEGLECEEIYDLSDTSAIDDALGFVFLFKWDGKEDNPGTLVTGDKLKSIFFAKQVFVKFYIHA